MKTKENLLDPNLLKGNMRKGNTILIIAIVVLILIAIGLWYAPTLTKHLVSGAASKAKDFVP